MIVCSCNRLSAADVRGCLVGHPPPRSVADVYGRLGCSPKCGTCARTIYGIMAAREREASAHQTAASFEAPLKRGTSG